MQRDFTLSVYEQLLTTIQRAGYEFYTFEQWCDTKPTEKFVILRHDVDLKAINSLKIAQLEAKLGIFSTYYFRVVPQSNQPEIIRDIVALGHEIGYHYEDLSLFNGNQEKAIIHFERQLNYFRQYYPVRTICMHGSPMSKWDNRNLWGELSYNKFGIIGEPYFDFLKDNDQHNSFEYFTDTARMWDGDKYNVRDKINTFVGAKKHAEIHSTFDFIDWVKLNKAYNGMMITTHPQRWTSNTWDWQKELILQSIKNFIKKLFYV